MAKLRILCLQGYRPLKTYRPIRYLLSQRYLGRVQVVFCFADRSSSRAFLRQTRECQRRYTQVSMNTFSGRLQYTSVTHRLCFCSDLGDSNASFGYSELRWHSPRQQNLLKQATKEVDEERMDHKPSKQIWRVRASLFCNQKSKNLRADKLEGL